jgi:hypothetical protein
MARISVVLDRPDRTYAVGAPVAGTVEVDLAEAWPDARLVLARQWRATGHAETDTGEAVEVVLFEGTRPPGRTSHPIAFDAPWGPVTHHGTLLRVGWFLTARLEGRGPTLVAEEELFLVGPEDPEKSTSVSLGPEFGAEEDWAHEVLGLVQELADPVLSPFARWAATARRVGIVRLFTLATSWLAGPFEARLDREEVRRQDRITCAVRLPRRFLEASGAVTATLSATERTRRRADHDDDDAERTHTTRVVERAPAARIGKIEREAGELLLTITVPADAPPTFASAHNRLEWSVTVRVQRGRRPAWEARLALAVRP